MSQKKQTIDLHPDGRNNLETFAFTGFKCPYCSGRGFFIDEIGRNEQKKTNCPFCSGASKVMCTVIVKWTPQHEEKERKNS